MKLNHIMDDPFSFEIIHRIGILNLQPLRLLVNHPFFEVDFYLSDQPL